MMSLRQLRSTQHNVIDTLLVRNICDDQPIVIKSSTLRSQDRDISTCYLHAISNCLFFRSSVSEHMLGELFPLRCSSTPDSINIGQRHIDMCKVNTKHDNQATVWPRTSLVELAFGTLGQVRSNYKISTFKQIFATSRLAPNL